MESSFSSYGMIDFKVVVGPLFNYAPCIWRSDRCILIAVKSGKADAGDPGNHTLRTTGQHDLHPFVSLQPHFVLLFVLHSSHLHVIPTPSPSSLCSNVIYLVNDTFPDYPI